ncbi:hypothetical protein [Pyrococcus woesei]|uniref:hypothetical protein n=1 Tax=Pyrococcus woesei TaxID=2262 RepID=UPI003D2F2E97
MRIEVPSRDHMNELSKALSKAGIMNRPKEEMDIAISNSIVFKDKFSKLMELPFEEVRERLRELESLYKVFIEMLKEKELSFEEIDEEYVEILEALENANAIEIVGEKLKLAKDVPLEDLEFEVSIPLEDIYERVEEFEKAGGKLVTEVLLSKKYYVEVMEVDFEAIQKALEIAEDYTEDDIITKATLEGLARSTLAELILNIAKEVNRKNELLDILLALEPVSLEGEKSEMRIYFERDAVEDFLKELQTLGYIKVKGNRIWFY